MKRDLIVTGLLILIGFLIVVFGSNYLINHISR
jgi:hypothetical protein